MTFVALVVAQDMLTAGCGLLNAGYFAEYWWRRNGTRGRRTGAAAMALVSGAAVVEALFSQGLFWAQRGAGSPSHLSSDVWALMRLPLLLATAFISIIIMRRLLS